MRMESHHLTVDDGMSNDRPARTFCACPVAGGGPMFKDFARDWRILKVRCRFMGESKEFFG
ncbi:hypothetical protein CHELA17_60783 [Chelatococcus asaccharovorans]|nr:hypothetical protein CHELA17_60783 [Chelatococcus asaccharovorans]